ncbi:hypothetical protein CYMTET_41199 [Cymbomonas tetramitiformis]|uniref:Uncharacterized protein n=1 Tax=Cymbomonas tetramitiformis TaxID=36881 RepID=A0AAE0F2R8_9CHLO|nr:hypothetical protein CYMTET_41199 [Cymbomonas tetramitiformis]
MQAMNSTFLTSAPISVSRKSSVARAQPLNVVALFKKKAPAKKAPKKAAAPSAPDGILGFKFDWFLKDVIGTGIGTESEAVEFKSDSKYGLLRQK